MGRRQSSSDSIDGEDINPKSATVDELSIREGGASAVTKEVFYRAEDTDTTTPLSIDTGQAPQVYNSIIVRGTIYGHGVGSYEPVKIRINEITSQDYTSRSVTGTTVIREGAEYWADTTFDQSYLDALWKIGANSDIGSSGRGANIRSLSSGYGNSERLIDGYANAAGTLPVESVQVSTDWAATATMNFVGVEY